MTKLFTRTCIMVLLIASIRFLIIVLHKCYSLFLGIFKFHASCKGIYHSGMKNIFKKPNKTEMIHRLVVYNIFNSFNKNSEEFGKKLNGMKN